MLELRISGALKEAFTKAENDPGVKVVVLRANGEAFCAGADLATCSKLQQFSLEENLADSHHLKELFLKIYQLKKVVNCSVQGHALAGGCGWPQSADFVFAVPEANLVYGSKNRFYSGSCLVFLVPK